MNLENLKQQFHQVYPETGGSLLVAFAPGRVNLIGEHTDYNGGYVLPCAINLGTFLVVRTNTLNRLRFSSANFDEKAEIAIEHVRQKSHVTWVNYPLGVINELMDIGMQLTGMDFYFQGNIPAGAGLSSSASVEMVTAATLNQLYSLKLDVVSLVKLSQNAENKFVGVNCGIMDQFAVGLCKKNHALFLNCRTLDYKLIPLYLKNYSVVIANTNKKRALAESKYNERVSECARAVSFISKHKPVSMLGDLSYQDGQLLLDTFIEDEMVRRRAKHVLTENQRVLDAVHSLTNGDLKQFGQLMNASHSSLQHDYEVTGYELDVMVEEAQRIEGVIGARMTGAGFGGCSVNIVENSQINYFISKVGENYFKRTGLTAAFYVIETADGVKILEN